MALLVEEGEESVHLMQQIYLASWSGFGDIGLQDTKFAIASAVVWSKDLSHAQLAYLLSAVVMTLLTILLYWKKGPSVTGPILVYLFSLSTITLSIKSVFMTYGYSFPKFVSCLHIFASGGVAFLILLHRRFVDGLPLKVPTNLEWNFSLLPIAFCFSANIVTNNMALVYLGAGFVEMIGGCGPIFVFLITSVTNRYVNYALLIPIIIVCIGTGLCAESGYEFSFRGLCLAFCAAFLRALKSTMQQSLMKAGLDPMDPVEAMAWLSIPSVVIMGCWCMATEMSGPFHALYDNPEPGLYFSLLISCLNAIVLNLSNLFVIRDLGALGVNVAGQLKGILIILGSVAMLGEQVGLAELTGYCIVVGGVFLYNKVDKAHSEDEDKMLLTPPIKHK
jgi:drug/metabolite transporter (DMT)-like permease